MSFVACKGNIHKIHSPVSEFSPRKSNKKKAQMFYLAQLRLQ